jgi:AraC-like DNA-binding protein
VPDPTFVLRAGPPALAGSVLGYCGYVEDGSAPVRRREPAGTRVPVILSFGDAITVEGGTSPGRPARVTSFVAPFSDTWAVTEHAGRQHGVQVDLTPLGAFRLLGVQPSEVAGSVVPVDDLWGPAGGSLVDRLASAPDWPSRFGLLDEVLLVRAASGAEPHPAVAWAWRQLERADGGVPVGTLADEIGWSRRHFVDRFRRHVGLAPKASARVLRFARAHALLSAGTAPVGLVAAECGYADQSHLVRETRALAGCTPSELVGEVTSVQAGA